jgi:hypothetical protein
VLHRPRRISGYEAQIVRRVLEVGARVAPSRRLRASIDQLRVHQEGDFQNDSLDFGRVRGINNDIVAMAIGLMANDAPVELILWAHHETVTYLELEPFNGTWRPIRLPRLETIRPYAETTGR